MEQTPDHGFTGGTSSGGGTRRGQDVEGVDWEWDVDDLMERVGQMVRSNTPRRAAGVYLTDQLVDFNESNQHLRILRRLRSCKIRSPTIFQMHCLMPQPHDPFITSVLSLRQVHSQSWCVPLTYFVSRLRLSKETHACHCITERTGRTLTNSHLFLSDVLPTSRSSDVLTKYLVGLLPDQTIGGRSNVKNYGREVWL